MITKNDPPWSPRASTPGSRTSSATQGQLFAAESEAWTAGLQFYSLLQRRSKKDGALAANLEPIASFFAYRHDSAKPQKLKTRIKAKLKNAVDAAEKHGIAVSTAEAKPAVVVPDAPVVHAPSVTSGVTNGATNGLTSRASNGAAQ